MNTALLASFVAYGPGVLPVDDLPALLSALELQLKQARNDIHAPGMKIEFVTDAWNRSARIEDAIYVIERILKQAEQST